MTHKRIELPVDQQDKTHPSSTRTLEHILDEYKLIALKLFEFAGIVLENEGEATLMAKKQARLLDKQQALLMEACSVNLQTEKDASTILELWKADQIYGEEMSPDQAIVFQVMKYLQSK